MAILTSKLVFPNPATATADGLVAVGGDLSVERLLLAYRSGIFPWPIFADDLMTWFSPDPRAVLDLAKLRISRSLAKRIRRGDFEIRFDSEFRGVVRGCAAPGPGRPSTWITSDIENAYVDLHEAGHAHSVETWMDGELVGGLYGVSIGGFFAGESMFSLRSDASKLALIHLVERLRSRGFELLDIQQATRHLMSMGAEEISRPDYLRRLSRALAVATDFG